MSKFFRRQGERFLIGALVSGAVTVAIFLGGLVLYLIANVVAHIFELLASPGNLNLGNNIAALILVGVPMVVFAVGTAVDLWADNDEKQKAIRADRARKDIDNVYFP